MKVVYENKEIKNNSRHNNVLYKRVHVFVHMNLIIHLYLFQIKERETIEVYGCFVLSEVCSYLKNEQIDDSTRWERHNRLIICSKIYNYEKKKNQHQVHIIRWQHGNLTIEEYRKLLKNERLMMVVDKPLTKILLELFEEIMKYQIYLVIY